MAVPMLDSVRVWECPSCGFRKRTTQPGAITPMHPCSEHDGLDIPLQQAGRHGTVGPAHKIKVIERGDWVGAEQVQHGGIMAVHSYRPDGSHDTVVFAPTATAAATSNEE